MTKFRAHVYQVLQYYIDLTFVFTLKLAVVSPFLLSLSLLCQTNINVHSLPEECLQSKQLSAFTS